MSDYVCEELIIEIFTRLPPKSLIRFRSLSKSLCSCIGSPGFIRMHTSRSPQKLLIRHNFYCKEENKYQNFYTSHFENQLPSCPRRGYIGITAVEVPYGIGSDIIGSCNGILCMREAFKGISLWNPLIRRKLIVPACPVDSSSLFRGFDPLGIGFGFDPIADDYKIVSIPIYESTHKSSYIYTMKTCVWCAIASPTPLFSSARSRGCFANGTLHWVVDDNFTKLDGEVGHFFILTFNLSTHVFGRIELPDPSLEANELTTFQGSLAVASTRHSDIWIWAIKEYNNIASWFVVFKSKTCRVQGILQRVLPLTNNGHLLFSTDSESFQVYDPKIGMLSTLLDYNANSFIYEMEMYVESLQLLDMGQVCNAPKFLPLKE